MIALNKPKSNLQIKTSGSIKWLAVTLLMTSLLTSQVVGQEGYPPSFYKTFAPDIIGPGGNSLLTFTINNSESNEPVDELAFTDVLPSGMTISAAPNVSSTCGEGAIIVANPGESTITFSGGQLAAGATCTISLYVTAEGPVEGSTVVYTNTSGDLTSDAGNSGTATDDLTVTTDRPGFSKSFSPSTVDLGETSTLTFTIDNTANSTSVVSISFTDNLPQGLVIANPANLSTDCGSASITASPGTSLISFSSGILTAGSSCTVQVEVMATGSGTLENVSSELMFLGAPNFNTVLSGGTATASLEVTRGNPLNISKQFTNDPVPPGGTIDLEFTITNFDRNEAATGIAFDDNLEAVIAGLAPSGPLPSTPCGGTLSFSMGVLSLTGGSLPPEGTCTFTVTFLVPAMTAPGAYHNTTTPVTGTVAGEGVICNQADADVFVSYSPLITKTFLNDPVAPGGTVDLQFTITNTSTTFDLTNISFSDEFESIIQSASLIPSDGDCGAMSDFTFVPAFGSNPAMLSLADGMLGPGQSCTFTIRLDVMAGVSGGIYPNTTSLITGIVNGEIVQGNPAGDDLEVLSAPRITKEFLNDPVVPGNTVDLEFTITYDEFATGNATNISFHDNLAAVFAGLVPSGPLPTDPCGSGSSLSFAGGVLSLSGGTLIPGGSCSFIVTLDVPPGAPIGTHTNTTSNIEATVLNQTVKGNVAKDDLLVNPLVFTKEFIGDPALPGEVITLRFTIDNSSGVVPVTGISFTDNLNAALSGLVAQGLPMMDVCGPGSNISGTSLLNFSGGNIAANASCTFDVPVMIPNAAANGNYLNVTSNLTATIDGNLVMLPTATDNLEINNDILSLTKAFTDDPVLPGGTVNLEFTIENLDPVRTINNISFIDDLNATLSGLSAVGLPMNDVCGTGSQISGTSLLTFMGGSLGPGASCTFSVTLQVPAMVSASDFVNTTSMVTGDVNGIAVEGAPATDVLKVRNLSLEKAFSGSGIGGGTVDLTFTFDNLQASPVTGINFSDNLNAMLAGTTILTLPSDVSGCGMGAMVSGAGTSTLSFTNGELGAGADCMFTITIQLPPCAATGQYTNTTSQVFASGLQSPAAQAVLDFMADGPPVIMCPVDPAPIELPAGFNPNPVGPNTPQDPSIAPSTYGMATATDNSEVTISYQDVVIPPNPMSCPNSYKVKRTWKATDECDSMSVCVQTFSFFINPSLAGVIRGPVTICPSLDNLPYSTNAVADATSYDWSFSSPSATITGNGTRQVSISFDETFDGGTLSVTATNACGTSAPQTLDILLGSPQFCELTSCLAENDDVNVTNELLAQMGAPDVYKAINNLESAATIQALKTIIFRAGNEILLKPPFTVEQGAVFIAEIEGCLLAKSKN